MRSMYNNYNKKNQVKTILPVFNEYLQKTKHKYFISNNSTLNDTCITKIIDLISFNLHIKKEGYNVLKISSI